MSQYDVIVLGGGPGGYVAAIRAGQLGLKVALVEKERVGGVCTNWGCIPSKALLRNAEVLSLIKRAAEFGITVENVQADYGKGVQRSRQVVERLIKGIEFLLKKNKVELIPDFGLLTSANTIQLQKAGKAIDAKHVIIATGAHPIVLPGVQVDGKVVTTSREALESTDLPKSVVVIGGGAVGLEFAYVYATYGAKVTVVELLPSILPSEDEEITKVLADTFTKKGIDIKTGTKVTGIEVKKSRASVAVTAADGASAASIECDRVLLGIGVRGNVEGFGLEKAGVKTERGFIQIDGMMRTSAPGVFAVGDVTGKSLLAHAGMAMGVTAVEHIAGKEPPEIDFDFIPRVVFCQPQVASFGLTEKQAKAKGFEVKVGRFPFRGIGKAIANADYEGMAKLVVDAKYGTLLGAHLVGHDVSELIGELVVAHALESTNREVGLAVHPHPTLSEVLKEAALAVDGEAIHI